MVLAAPIHNPHKSARAPLVIGTYEQSRSNAYRRGYNRRWGRARKMYLHKNPLCAECKRRNQTTLATQLDHIIPHRGDPRLFWDQNNWQSLCDTHHARKTRAENAQLRRQWGGLISMKNGGGDRVSKQHFFLAKNQKVSNVTRYKFTK